MFHSTGRLTAREMSATGDTEERKDEQVISSPPTLNRVSKTLHDHGEDTSSASESGPSSHGPATGGRKTVSSLLKDALGFLGCFDRK